VHKDAEEAVVDEIRVLAAETAPPPGSAAGAGIVQRVSIKLRYNRNPIVGDKFSSRHGQKGVLSYLWPVTDMPFTDNGVSPDVIINPHAFPSRMTIGMLVESMAGKAGALGGRFADASPFRFNEGNRVVDHVGEQLRGAGYAYYGTETMYSGVTGEPLSVDIYLGVVYYQRLRHMVADKAQARATGKVNNLTRQPVKGRKKHGGIRFGEMERDSLLAHGASFLLHDRLMNCSDRHTALVCGACGSLLSAISKPAGATEVALLDAGGSGGGVPVAVASAAEGAGRVDRARRAPLCVACGHGDAVVAVPVPYVFRYLANELAAMNIRVALELGPGPHARIRNEEED
jgi:DNA-directed RNA polymerase I subunit RPA2